MTTFVTIIRGLPGSGKSTLAKKIQPNEKFHCEADKFFVKDGSYNFDPSKIKDAHNYCQESFITAINTKHNTPIHNVVVSNTFTQMWEMAFYIGACKSAGIEYSIIDLYDGGFTNETLFSRNVHGVPMQAIERMRARYELFDRNKFNV